MEREREREMSLIGELWVLAFILFNLYFARVCVLCMFVYYYFLCLS